MQATDDSEHATRDWFAVQVRAGRERLCEKHLFVRGYKVFLPCYRERRQWSDRAKTVERALFGGYLFCRVSTDVVASLVTTPGVIRIVSDGHRPLPVDRTEMESLQRVVGLGLDVEPWEWLRSGQRVEIVEGPLSGTVGTVVTVKSRHRLILSLSILQRSVAVEVASSQVRLDAHEWLSAMQSGLVPQV